MSTAANKVTAPYGSWKSPITADVVSGANKELAGMALSTHARLLYLESRPADGGRLVLVKQAEKPDDEPWDLTPEGFSVRTLVQEYGGGAFRVYDDTVIFSNYDDQRLYKQRIVGDSIPVPITPDYGGQAVRYADGVIDLRFNRYIAVREDHRQSNLSPVTDIVAVDLKHGSNQEPKVLISGNDFYAFPRVNSNGKKFAWVEWAHPNMHWDRAQLWVGNISDDGEVCNRVCIAGGDPAIVESPSEPRWSPKGELFFITDRKNGFWNIYKWVEDKNELLALTSMEAEFTRPLWVFGYQSYDFVWGDRNADVVACSYRQNGRSSLCILDASTAYPIPLDVSFTDIGNVVSGPSCLYIEGASAYCPLSVAKVSLDGSLSKVTDFSIIWSASPDCLKYQPYISSPEVIEFSTGTSDQTAYAYFYPPANHGYQASVDEKPPLLLRSHGGPTAEAREVLDLNIQFWTSRGWAFVDVNYGGSTGYGRHYRERLLGAWGIVDVNDCCRCAEYLVESGKVDKKRLCMTGESAGGYTTLASLTFRDTFMAGASLYGVADLSLLVAEIHKLESHYINNLVGDDKAFYERSPINFVEKFSCPVILFQGLDDKVVPPGQARMIYQALKNKGLPVALVEYEGEQHGFRKAANIKFTLEQQMMFFARLVGQVQVADDITPIKIDNFD